MAKYGYFNKTVEEEALGYRIRLEVGSSDEKKFTAQQLKKQLQPAVDAIMRDVAKWTKRPTANVNLDVTVGKARYELSLTCVAPDESCGREAPKVAKDVERKLKQMLGGIK